MAGCRTISILRKNRTGAIFSHRDLSRVVNQRTIIWPQEIFSCWNKATISEGARQAHAAHSTGQSGQSEHKIRFILPPREARRIKMYIVKICKSHLP